MKKETAIFVFCLALAIVTGFHYYYTKHPIVIGYAILPPLMLLFALSASKKIRTPDYSTQMSAVGILFVIVSYVIYLSYSFGVWQNPVVEFVFSLACIVYALNLAWYKGRLFG
jgi:hypothetical protein